MTSLAATASQAAEMPQAEAFLRAGEQWMLADEPAEAVICFRRAMAAGGPFFLEPCVPLARALFQLGRDAEAQAIISRLKNEGQPDPRICDMVAELLVERGELPAALEWATVGVEQCLRQPGPADEQAAADPGRPRRSPAGDRSELRLLLSLRYRIRNDLGLPEDAYDHMLDES
ncbi:MAG TPA: tetratricopeptide repeat protein [Streptosporangiaceae bacterium]|nr:tetratricopeptide repeat protein [Streptosporangiaceae bacterium]